MPYFPQMHPVARFTFQTSYLDVNEVTKTWTTEKKTKWKEMKEKARETGYNNPISLSVSSQLSY